jgi:hypothetical protein
MRETDDPNMPTQPVLDALRRRRTQLHDPQVKALLAAWKQRGHPIQYLDLDEVAVLIRVENPKASTRRRIVAAVKAVGIEIRSLDGWRRSMDERGMMPSLNGLGVALLLAEARWRWPEKWDRQQARKRRTRVILRRGGMEYILKRKEVKPGDEVLPWPDDERYCCRIRFVSDQAVRAPSVRLRQLLGVLGPSPAPAFHVRA